MINDSFLNDRYTIISCLEISNKYGFDIHAIDEKENNEKFNK